MGLVLAENPEAERYDVQVGLGAKKMNVLEIHR